MHAEAETERRQTASEQHQQQQQQRSETITFTADHHSETAVGTATPLVVSTHDRQTR